MAPTYKLTYFPITALAEPIRFLLSYGGAKFEDVRVDKATQWPTVKPTTPFGQVPVLEIDGKKMAQSSAICRYLAKQFGVSGKDDWENMQIDIVVDTITDMRMPMGRYWYETDMTMKPKYKEIVMKETLPFYLPKLEEMVKKNGGYFVGGKLTWADIYWTAIVGYLNAMCEMTITDKYPMLKALEAKVLALPAIKAWVAKRPKSPM